MAIAQNGVVVRQWIADFVAETLRTETFDQVVDRLDAAIIGRLRAGGSALAVAREIEGGPPLAFAEIKRAAADLEPHDCA